MKCECGGETAVIDSRFAWRRGEQRSGQGPSIRRRRRCEACGARFTTYEVRQDRLSLLERSEESARQLARWVAELGGAKP